MVYNNNQFEKIIPFIETKPQSMILGGPSDGNEAQCARSFYPYIQIIGIEPNQHARFWQRDNNWPSNALLLHYALSDTCGISTISIPPLDLGHNAIRWATLYEPQLQTWPKEWREEVETITIDRICQLYGPFPNCLLWLDIENHEYNALLGATDLLSSGMVNLINIECMERSTDNDRKHILLSNFGYKCIKIWGNDRVYVKSKSLLTPIL